MSPAEILLVTKHLWKYKHVGLIELVWLFPLEKWRADSSPFLPAPGCKIISAYNALPSHLPIAAHLPPFMYCWNKQAVRHIKETNGQEKAGLIGSTAAPFKTSTRVPEI